MIAPTMTETFRAAQVAPTEVVSSERTTDGSPLPRRGLRLSWQLPVLIVTWLSLLQWPVPPTGALDPSWCLVLSDAWQHGRQFGTEIIFTWGPWGFLFQPYVVPGTVSFKLAFDLAAKLLLAVGVVGFATRLGPLWRALFIIVVWWLGAVLWATWLVGLGFFTGSATGLPFWASSLIGVAVGLVIGAVVGLIVTRRRGDRSPVDEPAPGD